MEAIHASGSHVSRIALFTTNQQLEIMFKAHTPHMRVSRGFTVILSRSECVSRHRVGAEVTGRPVTLVEFLQVSPVFVATAARRRWRPISINIPPWQGRRNAILRCIPRSDLIRAQTGSSHSRARGGNPLLNITSERSFFFPMGNN